MKKELTFLTRLLLFSSMRNESTNEFDNSISFGDASLECQQAIDSILLQRSDESNLSCKTLDFPR